MEIVLDGEKNAKVTMSLGVATYPGDGTTSQSLLKSADSALYLSKEDGRNRVTIASETLRSQPAIDRGQLYVGTDDGQIVCVDTGNAAFTNWSTWGGNPAHTGVATK
jgi:hypothetical protein